MMISSSLRASLSLAPPSLVTVETEVWAGVGVYTGVSLVLASPPPGAPATLTLLATLITTLVARTGPGMGLVARCAGDTELTAGKLDSSATEEELAAVEDTTDTLYRLLEIASLIKFVFGLKNLAL